MFTVNSYIPIILILCSVYLSICPEANLASIFIGYRVFQGCSDFGLESKGILQTVPVRVSCGQMPGVLVALWGQSV